MPVPLTTAQRIEALQRIAADNRVYITPAMAAPVMGCAAYLINLMVDRDIDTYGEIRSFKFGVERRGRRVLINQREFLEYYSRELGLTDDQPDPSMVELIAQRTAEILSETLAETLKLIFERMEVRNEDG